MDPVLFGLVGVVIGALVAGLGSILVWANGRRTARVAELGGYVGLNQYIDKRVDALVEERIGDLRDQLREAQRRANVFVRIVRSIALQWPANSPPPLLDADLIEAAEDALPTHWIHGSNPEGGGSQ